MVTAVYFGGELEGAKAEIEASPKSSFNLIREALKQHRGNTPKHRRFAALFLHSVCEWDYQQIGIALGTHRGRALRMVAKAKREAAEILLQDDDE